MLETVKKYCYDGETVGKYQNMLSIRGLEVTDRKALDRLMIMVLTLKFLDDNDLGWGLEKNEHIGIIFTFASLFADPIDGVKCSDTLTTLVEAAQKKLKPIVKSLTDNVVNGEGKKLEVAKLDPWVVEYMVYTKLAMGVLRNIEVITEEEYTSRLVYIGDDIFNYIIKLKQNGNTKN